MRSNPQRLVCSARRLVVFLVGEGGMQRRKSQHNNNTTETFVAGSAAGSATAHRQYCQQRERAQNETTTDTVLSCGSGISNKAVLTRDHRQSSLRDMAGPRRKQCSQILSRIRGDVERPRVKDQVRTAVHPHASQGGGGSDRLYATNSEEKAVPVVIYDLKDELDSKIFSNQTSCFPVMSFRRN